MTPSTRPTWGLRPVTYKAAVVEELVRELRDPPAMVWQALTDPAQLSEWAPFDADRNLAPWGG